jgi:hypothetical protein
MLMIRAVSDFCDFIRCTSCTSASSLWTVSSDANLHTSLSLSLCSSCCSFNTHASVGLDCRGTHTCEQFHQPTNKGLSFVFEMLLFEKSLFMRFLLLEDFFFFSIEFWCRLCTCFVYLRRLGNWTTRDYHFSRMHRQLHIRIELCMSRIKFGHNV